MNIGHYLFGTKNPKVWDSLLVSGPVQANEFKLGS